MSIKAGLIKNMTAICKKCKNEMNDDITTVHLHLVKNHNMAVGEAVESVSEYIEFN